VQHQGTALTAANDGDQLVEHAAFGPATDELLPPPVEPNTLGYMHITDAIRLAWRTGQLSACGRPAWDPACRDGRGENGSLPTPAACDDACMSVDLTAVCVFCGSNRGASPAYEQAARDVGRLLAEQGIGLVYGGASEGLMGVVADAALAAGGAVTGVMPRDLAAEEPPHAGLSELHLVGTMHERKALMAERSSAFLALPGGLGTLEEAFEAISWTQLRLQDKPTGFLNVGGFFEPTMQQLDRMVAEGFVRREHRDGIYQPARLLRQLAQFESPDIHKWIDRDLTL
jgi:uncharacterized protein (TIGR00730 family)